MSETAYHAVVMQPSMIGTFKQSPYLPGSSITSLLGSWADFECLVLRGEEEKGLNTNRRQVCSGHIGTVTYIMKRQKHMNTVACLITHKLCIFWKQHQRPRQRRLLSMVMRNLPPKRLCIERRTERTSYEADHLSCKNPRKHNPNQFDNLLLQPHHLFDHSEVVFQPSRCCARGSQVFHLLLSSLTQRRGRKVVHHLYSKHFGYYLSYLRNFSTGPTLSVTCPADQWSHFFSGKHFWGAMLHGLSNRTYACVSEKDER